MEIKQEDLLDSINTIRSNPNTVLQQLKNQLNRFETSHVFRNRSNSRIRTVSGKQAWQDCILSLQRQKSKSSLAWSKQLGQAAQTYSKYVNEGKDMNPFDIIKSICSYTGQITFTINELELDNNLTQILAAILVCDGDEKKASRTAVFHPLYRLFGCSISKQGARFMIYMIFAESIGSVKQASNVKYTQNKQTTQNSTGSNYKSDQRPIKGVQKHQEKKIESQPQEQNKKKDFIRNGKKLIIELNKVRKQPKQYVHILKSQLSKFKDDKVLVTQHGELTTKEGKAPYQDLISQMESQYPLPTIRESMGLTITALEQLLESQAEVQGKSSVEVILNKFCTDIEGIRSIKLVDANDMPIQDILLRLLVGDGDRKRTARRKMLSPICKVIGCCISSETIVVNVGEKVKDSAEAVEEYLESLERPKKQKQPIKAAQKVQKVIKSKEGEKLVAKKLSKSHTEKRDGHQYKITDTTIVYSNGEEEFITQEQLIK